MSCGYERDACVTAAFFFSRGSDLRTNSGYTAFFRTTSIHGRVLCAVSLEYVLAVGLLPVITSAMQCCVVITAEVQRRNVRDRTHNITIPGSYRTAV